MRHATAAAPLLQHLHFILLWLLREDLVGNQLLRLAMASSIPSGDSPQVSIPIVHTYEGISRPVLLYHQLHRLT